MYVRVNCEFRADEESSECRDVNESEFNEPRERKESELRVASLAVKNLV